jgi:von Willebrand factor type A C-terminal domain/von Willebrand factor type A domain
MSQPDFAVEISQNEYLPEGGDDVNAIVAATSPDTVPVAAADTSSAEIIIIDCSGSMRSPQTKIMEARAATAAAVDVIRDGVAFAVVAGTDQAQPVFPHDGSLAVVDAATGTVRLKKKVDDADEMALDTRSTKTVRTRK